MKYINLDSNYMSPYLSIDIIPKKVRTVEVAELLSRMTEKAMARVLKEDYAKKDEKHA